MPKPNGIRSRPTVHIVRRGRLGAAGRLVDGVGLARCRGLAGRGQAGADEQGGAAARRVGEAGGELGAAGGEAVGDGEAGAADAGGGGDWSRLVSKFPMAVSTQEGAAGPGGERTRSQIGVPDSAVMLVQP